MKIDFSPHGFRSASRIMVNVTFPPTVSGNAEHSVCLISW